MLYVALIRGVMPSNPKMRNDRLCAAIAKAGGANPVPVLASGNVVFSSNSRSTAALERKIEQAFQRELGLTLDVMVRSQAELQALVDRDPFQGAKHGGETYLVVTFFKDRRDPLCTALTRTQMASPEFMAQADKSYGKHITTRTWNTLLKILAKMHDEPRSPVHTRSKRKNAGERH